jgi:hypothetical protein
MSCSPRRRIRLVTVIGELTAGPHPVGPTCLRQLDTSNGCQDHTVLPSATRLRQEASPGLVPVRRSLSEDRSNAVRLRAARSLTVTCPAIPFTPDAAASTASHPASVTIAIRPSVGWDSDGYEVIWVGRKRKYFCKRGWTRRANHAFTNGPARGAYASIS